MKKRLLSLFCAFALLVGLIPAVAFAVDDTGQAIQFVDNGTAANIIGGQADSIYFGTYQQSSAGDTQPSGPEACTGLDQTQRSRIIWVRIIS